MVRLSERLRRRRHLEFASDGPHEYVAQSARSTLLEKDDKASERNLDRELPVGWLGREDRPASSLLYERLGDEDVAEIERLLKEAPDLERMLLEAPDLGVRRQFALHFGVWMRVPAVIQKTGLRPDQPPEDVHSMARGPLAGAGGLYEADLVADALSAAGIRIEDVRCGLDFGCSSGRVVRVLAAAYRRCHWLACDPNERSIAWARANLPEVEFFVNGDEPPLPVDESLLDLAFAISIWSHFEPSLGLQWFEEMHRAIRPGGHLVFTTHGITSIAFYARDDLRSRQQSEEIADALYQRGWWYQAEFGEEGDWGVVNPRWGTSFLSPEWLLTELCPQWRVLEFAPGRNAWNQDVYVLQRV